MSVPSQQKQFFKHKAFNLISFSTFNSLGRSSISNHFLSKRSLSKSFTVVELSIVIVVISIMLSIILASRALINSGKINKIYEEYRMYNNAITIFYNTYNCMPGDCPITSISDISASISSVCNTTVSSITALANSTNTEIYNTLGTGLIESTTKRTCMFQQLQVAGFIAGKVNLNYNTGTYPLTDSVAGQTIPSAMFNNKAAWDFRHVLSSGELSVGLYNIPDEIGLISSWNNQHMLLLRDANSVAGRNSDMTYSYSGGQTSGGPIYAISANMSQKLDTKFDDGLPYAGNIASGLNITVWVANSNTGANQTCNNVTGYLGNGTMPTASYISSNNIALGCLVAFLIPNFA